MDIAANMQMNMLLQPIEGISWVHYNIFCKSLYTFFYDLFIRMYSNVPKIYIPIFYFSQHVELQDDLAGKLRMIQNVPDYLNYACIAFITLGLILIVWSSYSIFSVCTSQKNKKEEKYEAEMIPIADTNGKVY